MSKRKGLEKVDKARWINLDKVQEIFVSGSTIYFYFSAAEDDYSEVEADSKEKAIRLAEIMIYKDDRFEDDQSSN